MQSQRERAGRLGRQQQIGTLPPGLARRETTQFGWRAILRMSAPRQRVAVSSWWAEAIAFNRPVKVFRKPSSEAARRADCSASDCTDARTFLTPMVQLGDPGLAMILFLLDRDDIGGHDRDIVQHRPVGRRQRCARRRIAEAKEAEQRAVIVFERKADEEADAAGEHGKLGRRGIVGQVPADEGLRAGRTTAGEVLSQGPRRAGDLRQSLVAEQHHGDRGGLGGSGADAREAVQARRRRAPDDVTRSLPGPPNS